MGRRNDMKGWEEEIRRITGAGLQETAQRIFNSGIAEGVWGSQKNNCLDFSFSFIFQPEKYTVSENSVFPNHRDGLIHFFSPLPTCTEVRRGHLLIGSAVASGKGSRLYTSFRA